MEAPQFLNRDERIFTLEDVKALFFRLRKKIIRVTVLAALTTFFLLALKSPLYKAEATFKEENEKTSDSLLTSLMGESLGGTVQPQASILMKSFQVLKPLIQKLGLQAQVPSDGWILGKVYRRLSDNWKAERRIYLEDPDRFIFANVVYEGVQSLQYTLSFQDLDHFTISEKGKQIAKGVVGNEVLLPNSSFTLVRPPHKIKIGVNYPFRIASWVSVAEVLQKKIEIQGSKVNKAILELSFSDRDRYLAADLLNQLMKQYQIYLKEDHDQTALGQLDYLNEKKQQIYDKISEMFQSHASYLKKNLETKGILALKDEVQSCLVPYHKFQQTILGIEIELSRLDQMEKENSIAFDLNETPFSKQCAQLSTLLQDLKRQKDLLEISFDAPRSWETIEDQLVDRERELSSLREKRNQAQLLLEKKSLPKDPFDPEHSLALWAKELDQTSSSQYLTHYVHLLSMQEKVLQEKGFYEEEIPSHFDGIDLNMARTLFVEYNGKLDQAENLVRYYEQLIDEIEENHFEIGSLSSILKDPLSQHLIEEANKIAVQLKDEKHHSAKEGERWREELNFQKKVLVEHLQQLNKVELLNAELTRKKMASLQHISLDGINREISVLYERMGEMLKERRVSLFQEKNILEKKMEELRSVSADFPEQWRQEKWLDLNIQMGLKMMEVMTEMVEGKTVAQHLHHVESKPLDLAITPLLPKKPSLLLSSFVGGAGVGFCFFFCCLISSILKGFPLTLEKLNWMKYPTAGQISSFCDGPSVDPLMGSDLELIRRLSLFVDQTPGKIVGLIGGKGPDYSHCLAQNLAEIGRRSLIVRCDFSAKFNSDDLPGVLQVCKGEIFEIPLRREKGFDYMTAGGFTSHGTEVIRSQSFQDILLRSKDDYDSIFVLIRSPLSSTESMASLRLCDKAIVTISGESIEELTPFVEWAYDEKHKTRLTFITSDKI